MTFEIWKLFVILIVKVEARLLESSNAVVVVLEGGLDASQGHVVLLTEPNDASSVCFHTRSGLENLARVVCRQFGAFGGHAGPSPQGTRSAFVPSVSITQNGCRGTEPSILDCYHTESTTCTEGLNYTIYCSRDSDVHRGIRLVDGGVMDGIVELYYHGKWIRIKGKVAGDGTTEAVVHQLPLQVACRQLGFSGGTGEVIETSNGTGQLDIAEGYASVSCDGQDYTSLYQCTIEEDDSPAPFIRLQCTGSSPDTVAEGVLPAYYASQGLHPDYVLHLSSMDGLVFEVQSCSGLKLRLFPTGSSEDSVTEVIVDKLVPSRGKTQILLRECQDAYRCRSSSIPRPQSDRLFLCNGSDYPTDHAFWIRMNLNVKRLVNSGVLLVSSWPVPQFANLSGWIETHVSDRRSLSLTLTSPPRLLKYLEIASTDHQVAFRVPRDSNINKCLVTKAELEQGIVHQCGDDYVDEELCTVQCGCCFDANGLDSKGPSCFHPMASTVAPSHTASTAVALSPKACNRPFATLHGLVVILNNCPCYANTDATFIVLIQRFSRRLVAILDPGTGDENQTVAVSNSPKSQLPDWAAHKLNSVLITGVTEFAQGTVTHRYLFKGSYTARLLLFGSRPGKDVSAFQVAVNITKRRSLRDVVQNITFVNNGPSRRNRKVTFLIALSAVSAEMQVTLQHREFVTSLVTLDQWTPIPNWAQGKVENASSLTYRALIESSFDNPGLYKPALILSDRNFEDVIYRVGSVKVLSSEELAGGVYLLAEGGVARLSNTVTFALLVEKITNSSGATIHFGDGSMTRPQLSRFSKDLPSWVANEMAARWKNPFAMYGSLTTHMFWSSGEYHVHAEVTYDQDSISEPIRAEVVVTATCAIELALTGGGRDLANVVTYNKGDNFVIAGAVSLTCARDEVQSVGWNVYFLRQMSGSPFPVTDERPDLSNRLDEGEVKRMLQRRHSPHQDILFRVPSFTLRYGIYVFEINVTSTSGTHQTASSWVFIRPVDIGVQLSGQVHLRTGLNETVRFEVISQSDPDESPQSPSSPVAYQWYCVQGIGLLTPEILQSETGGCFGRGTNLSTESHSLAFNTSHLEYRILPQLYTFWVVALKGARSGYDHRFLELLADVTAPAPPSSPELPSDSGDPILVDVVCFSNCLASLDLDTKLTLTAVCRSCPPDEELVYTWELGPRDANPTIAEFNLKEHGVVNNGSTLTILPFLLSVFRPVQKVELYQLRVTVMRPNRRSQDAVYVFAVGVTHDPDEPVKMGESRSDASAAFLFTGHRDLVVQLFISSCLLLLMVASHSLPLSFTHDDTIDTLYLNFLALAFPCLSVFSLLMLSCLLASWLRAGFMFLVFIWFFVFGYFTGWLESIA